MWATASKPRSISSACNSLRGPKCSLPKSPFGWVNINPYYYFVCEPKFIRLSWNAGGIALDHISFRFWTSLSLLVPKIFAIKVWSCIKSPEILHVLGPKYFWWVPPNFGTCVIKRTQFPIMWQFHNDRPRDIEGQKISAVNQRPKKNHHFGRPITRRVAIRMGWVSDLTRLNAFTRSCLFNATAVQYRTSIN